MPNTREKLIELAEVIDSYFGCDAAYFDVDKFTLAKRIMEAGWTKQEWISVKDRLPEINEDDTVNCVLVTNGRLIHMAYFVNENWVFCENGQIKRPMFYDVTHWMPLPQPPKGE